MTESELRVRGYSLLVGYREASIDYFVYFHPQFPTQAHMAPDLGTGVDAHFPWLCTTFSRPDDPLLVWLLNEGMNPTCTPNGSTPAAESSKLVAADAKPFVPKPRNNDGRKLCCQCGSPTKKVTLFLSIADVCMKCGY